MNNGCCKLHLVGRQAWTFLFFPSASQPSVHSVMTTLQGLKIVSPSPVTFAKLFQVSRIQWHSSGVQLTLRNSLLKKAGSWESRAALFVPRHQESCGCGRGRRRLQIRRTDTTEASDCPWSTDATYSSLPAAAISIRASLQSRFSS